MARKLLSDKQRLMRELVQNGDCWEWSKSRTRKGYGRIGVGSRTDRSRRIIGTHRLAYELFIGPVPDGLFVCHSCDNPPCCNPSALRHAIKGRSWAHIDGGLQS